jgi:hypothetical protein
MNVLERIRRFWGSGRSDDHPLTEEERAERRPASTYAELADTASSFAGDDFDPDEPGTSGRD